MRRQKGENNMKINKRKSNWKFIGAALALSTAITVPVYGGTWIQNQAKPSVRGTVSNWWYQKDDGSYLKNQWVWLDGNQDGISECYCFNPDGYLYVSTTIDGYTVDATGAWTVNGYVQTKRTSAKNTNVKNTPATAGTEQAVGRNVSSVTVDEAKRISMNHAGVSEDRVSYITAKEDWDHNRRLYEVEFFADGKEYDYEILQSDGSVWKSKVEDQSYFNGNYGNQVSQARNITAEQATQMVTARIPGISASSVYIKQDYDDGRLEYEGKAYYNQMKYEFEIDAASGTFTDWEVESIYD